jgi:hypothetical protein
MTARHLGYGGWLLILVAVVVFIVSFEEMRYETTVARLKGVVLSKRTSRPRLRTAYHVTYRVTIQGAAVEREGTVASGTWHVIQVGDEVDVESVGVTPNETRLPSERLASSTAYRIIAASLGIAGIVLIVLRVRKGKNHG